MVSEPVPVVCGHGQLCAIVAHVHGPLPAQTTAPGLRVLRGVSPDHGPLLPVGLLRQKAEGVESGNGAGGEWTSRVWAEGCLSLLAALLCVRLVWLECSDEAPSGGYAAGSRAVCSKWATEVISNDAECVYVCAFGGSRQVLWQPTTAMVTAVTFSPDARLIVAGLLNGTCTFYLTEGMRYLTQVGDGAVLCALPAWAQSLN